MNTVNQRQGSQLKELRRRPGLRERIRRGIDRYLALPQLLASILMILLTVVQLTASLTPQESKAVATAIIVIWALFLLELLVQLWLAPDRTTFFRRHWLQVLATAVPFFSVLRVAVVIRVAPLLRLLIFGGRHMSATMRLLRRRHLGQIAIVTVFVVMIVTILEYVVESSVRGANITSLSQSLWWTATTITTIGSQLYPVSEAGRILGFLLMLYAVGGFSYFMASIASVLVGTDESKTRHESGRGNLVTVRISREQLQALRTLLDAADRTAEG